MIDLRMADLNIRIDNHDDYIEKQCRDYILPTDSSQTIQPEIFIQTNEWEIKQEERKLEGIWHGDGYAESIVVYEKISCQLPAFDAFVMHSSVIEVDGQAICFAARSGTGKSTHTAYWKELLGDQVTVINGDKPIYRFEGNDLMAYGTPWCGKEGWNTNTKAPLKALCLLERSDENRIWQVDGFEMLGAIMDQFYLPGGGVVDMPSLMELVDRMLTIAKVYRLSVKKEISAAKTAAEKLLTYYNS